MQDIANCVYSDIDSALFFAEKMGLPHNVKSIEAAPSYIWSLFKKQKKGVFKCGNPDAFILVKQLSGAEYAVGFFNLGDSNARIELSFWDMGLPASSGMGLTFRDCLNHMDMGLQTEFYAQTV